MKQVNFSNPGGFPLEQETLARLQTAYRSELYEALKRHFSIDLANDYILAHATSQQKGWAVIRQEDPVNPGNNVGILYPITIGTQKPYLKTTRTAVNLIYGTSASQTAYYDYEAEYSSQKYNDEVVVTKSGDVQTIKYYDVSNLVPVTDIKTIDEILKAINSSIDAIQANINTIEEDINLINESYLPINGSKAMQGDLDLGPHQLSKLDTKQTHEANVRSRDFRLGSVDRRGLLHPAEPLGRALVDSSDQSNTSLTLNYGPDWTNTYVGGKVYLNNINSSNSTGSLLVIDGLNQVTKSDTLIDSLLSRITALEKKTAIAVPIGMVAIWGKSDPIPEGWEEYVPLRGLMPVGLDQAQFEFDSIDKVGGAKNKALIVSELPKHNFYTFSPSNTATLNETVNANTYPVADSDGTSWGNETYRIRCSATKPTLGKSSDIGENQQFSLLNPYRVVQFIIHTGRSNDITPPTKPTLAVSVNSRNVTLNWSGATDEFGVVNYLIYRNQKLLATKSGTDSYHYDPNLFPGAIYNYYVVAKDKAGNFSTSDVVSVDIPEAIQIAAPTSLSCIYVDGDKSQILITWVAGNNSMPVDYVLHRVIEGHAEAEEWITTDQLSYTDYSYYNEVVRHIYWVKAIDGNGNESPWSIKDSILVFPQNYCFDVESLVTMVSGQSKKLKNVVIGDQLQGFSFPNEVDESEGDYLAWRGKLNEASKATVTVVNKITSVQPNYYEIKTADTTVRATALHPLLVTEDGENLQWVCVKNISPNMLLIDKTGKTKPIESIQFKDESLEVALLDVESVDSYVISGIVAHNNKPIE